MDERQDDAPEGLAYRDALYSQASGDRRGGYGYNPAQCFARVSGDSEPPARRKGVRRGLIAAVFAALLLPVLALLWVLGSGRLLPADPDAAVDSGDWEIYDDYTAALSSGAEGPALDLAAGEDTAGAEPLDAAEIYDIACACTVGIRVPGYAGNAPGQTGESAVNGTGIVLTEDGYILTSYRVIEAVYTQGADVLVVTRDGAELSAEVVGVEDDSDLAVLRVDETAGLTPARMGDSSALRVGQTVYAVGNPGGELTCSMTGGIVSALNRRVVTERQATVDMFQIDAVVGDGSAGGPVFNDRGQVIGVVTAGYAPEGMEGLGFVIPINDACAVARDLVEKGYVTGKAWLGLTIATVSEAAARYYDDMVEGVYVYAVESGSCAEAAGLEAGDIITAIDDLAVLTDTALARAVKQYHAGDSAVLTVCRDRVYITVTVVFDEELPAGKSAAAPAPDPAPPEDYAIRTG